MNDPMQLLATLLPRARSMDELVTSAAKLAPPPSPDYRPANASAALPEGGVARLPTPTTGGIGQHLSAAQPLPGYVPPMTQGESRTSLGSTLLGV